MRRHRRVLHLPGTDSPNVRRELMRRRGEPASSWPDETPGVLTYDEYRTRLATWDEARATVGVEARFFEGAGVLMFPPAWLARSQRLAEGLRGRARRARAMGVDPAEGGDLTAMCVMDEWGVIDLVALRTPDTSVIVPRVIALMHDHDLRADRVYIDRGGGGKQHVDRLRSLGHDVQTVAFGEAVGIEPRPGVTMLEERLDVRESRSAYTNRRAQMYGTVRQLLDPAGVGCNETWAAVRRVTGCDLGVEGFAIPAEHGELIRQLSPIPLTYDGEGRLYLLPKNKRDPKSNQNTLTELIGCSPDHADSLALACHGLTNQVARVHVGGLW